MTVRTFYRAVLTNPPMRVDFVSNAERGTRRCPKAPELLRLWDGLSVYETPEQAYNTVRQYPQLGAFIAAITIPDDGTFRYERTLAGEGHHTLWSNPDALLRCVSAVISVAAMQGGARQ